MIRQLNRLYWLAYLLTMAALFWVANKLLNLKADDAALLAFGLVAGGLFLAHIAFNVSGFALSYSVRQIPQVRDKGLRFHSMDVHVVSSDDTHLHIC